MDIYQFLKSHQIDYQKFDHPAVFTCEEAERLCPVMPGESIKNLFLQSKEGQYFLVVIGDHKRADLKKLALILDAGKFSFGSPEKLKQLLGVEPGSVTLLAVINDQDDKVKVVIDKALWGNFLQCHPLVNMATLVISGQGIEKFLVASGHQPDIIDVPEKTSI